jgi:SAM-dependent methyltransferase
MTLNDEAMTLNAAADSSVTEGALQLNEYVRQRQQPKPGDIIYLHLADLRQALTEFATGAAIAILDYGCGGSPYRGLFPNATYHCADHAYTKNLDFTINVDGLLPDVASEAYDMVLSTQVLEHVSSPQTYLREAFRVLKPGGVLLISTHGVYPDHGCPFDYWRWTADGLALELNRAGYAVRKIYRLTSGPRAVLFWLGQLASTANLPSGRFRRLLVRIIRKLYALNRARIDRFIDRNFDGYAVMSQPVEDGINFYVGLLALAQKPSGHAAHPVR